MKSTAQPEKESVVLSVIIVNYNGLKFLDSCLDSIQRNLSLSHEIIVVDNDSTDGSVEYLRERWPGVITIKSGENLGFAKGNNLGVSSASGTFYLLINNDTEVRESLDPIVGYLEQNQQVGLVGGRLRNPDGTIQPSAGYDHTMGRLWFTWMVPAHLPFLNGWQLFENRPQFYDQTHHEVDWVSGAFMCIRKSIWNEVGGFDPDIFMYVEDEDLCCRIRSLGYNVAFYAGCDTTHFEGGGAKGLSAHALSATVDSYRLLLKKRSGTLYRAITCTGLAAIFMIRACLYRLTGILRSDGVNKNKAKFFFLNAKRLVGFEGKIV